MRKKWLIGGVLLVSLCFATTAYAHIVGSFGDFLSGVKDENTTEKLKKELKDTKEQIEQLKPQVATMEKEYNKKRQAAELKLQFYNTIGLDTYMNFILQSDNIVDVLANQRIIEKKLEQDLQALNQLYLTYMPVKLAKSSLEGHVELLQIIQDNLEARKMFLAENPELKPEELASDLVMNWAANASYLDEKLQEDSKLLNDNMNRFFTRKTDQSPYRLEEDLFNKQSKVTYFFRSDHIYAHFKKDKADVILIGQIDKKDEQIAMLTFEAGFLNGVSISSNLLDKLPGFYLDYQKLNPSSKGFYVEQLNSAIIIQPIENAKE